jgi:hypothetical protein
MSAVVYSLQGLKRSNGVSPSLKVPLSRLFVHSAVLAAARVVPFDSVPVALGWRDGSVVQDRTKLSKWGRGGAPFRRSMHRQRRAIADTLVHSLMHHRVGNLCPGSPAESPDA